MSNFKNELFIKASKLYTKDERVDKCIEEMAELTQALLKERAGKITNVEEEIADVLNTLGVLCKYYDEHSIEEWGFVKAAVFNNEMESKFNG